MAVDKIDEIKIQQNVEAKEVAKKQPSQDTSAMTVPVGQNSVSAQKVVSSASQSTSVFTGSKDSQSVGATAKTVAVTVPQKATASTTQSSLFKDSVADSQSDTFQKTISRVASGSDSEEVTAGTFFGSENSTVSVNLDTSVSDELATKILSGESDEIKKLLSMKYTRADFKGLVSKARQSSKTAGIDFDKLSVAQKKVIAAAQLAFNKGIIGEKKLLEISDKIANTDLVEKLNKMQLEGKSNLSAEEIAKIKLFQQQTGRLSYFNIALGTKMAPTDEKRAALLKTATSPEFVQKQVETRAKEIQDKVITEKTSASVAKTLISSVQEGFTTTFNLIKDNVSNLCKGIAGLAKTVLSNVSNVFTTITKTISNVVEKFWETAKGKAIIERTRAMRKIVYERRVEEKKAEAHAEEAKETAQETQAIAEEQAKKTAATIENIKSNIIKKNNLSCNLGNNLSNKQILDVTKQTSTNDYLAMQKAMGQQAQAEKNADDAYWASRSASLHAFFATMSRIQAQMNLAYKAFYATIRGI